MLSITYKSEPKKAPLPAPAISNTPSLVDLKLIKIFPWSTISLSELNSLPVNVGQEYTKKYKVAFKFVMQLS
jgi:hypothetical protein